MMADDGLTGTLTFLFTDIEGSTSLWERQRGDMPAALSRHDELVRSAIEAHSGRVFSTGGDGFAAVFSRAGDALRGALQAQRALSVEPWSATTQLRVRMGLHSGDAHERGGDFFGPTVNRAARIMSAACGGQVLLSSATAGIADLGDDISLAALGPVTLKGIDRPIVLHELVAAGVRQVGGVVADSAKGNLPSPVNEFVGDIAGLLRRLDDLSDVRLVTLTGPGGVGKTRLACEVGGLVSARYPDGVWIVELAAVLDSDEVLAVAASILRVIPDAGASIEDALRTWLSGRRMLLIIDNCEHVLAAAARLANLAVSASQTVTVIATSREPLGLSGEVIRSVASLEPAGDGATLFADRARAVNEHFRLDESTTADVVAICSRLDGIPLAIELAAARARSLAPGEILQRLTDRFRLLRGSGRDGIERQHTLRATVTWSYQLLSTDEQLLFDRLAVFAGWFDLAGVEAVCSDDRLDELDIVDLLGSLVDKSMVVADQIDSSSRYRMLETLRQFAEERLDAAGDTITFRDRHLAVLLAATPAHAARLCSPAEGLELRWFSDRWDNIRAAFQWAIASGEHSAAATLLRIVRWHAFVSGSWETEVWAEQLIAVTENTSNAAVGHSVLSSWASVRFDPASAQNHADCTLELPDVDESVRSTAWFNVALAALFSGDTDRAFDAATRALDCAQRGDEGFPEMWALQAMVICQTDPTAHAAGFDALHAFADRTGCPSAIALAWGVHSAMLTSTDDPDLIDRLLREADHAARLLDSIGGDAVVSANLTMGRINLLTARLIRSDAASIAELLGRLDADTARASAPSALDCIMRWLIAVEPSPTAATLVGFAATHLNWMFHREWHPLADDCTARFPDWPALSSAGAALTQDAAMVVALTELRRIALEPS